MKELIATRIEATDVPMGAPARRPWPHALALLALLVSAAACGSSGGGTGGGGAGGNGGGASSASTGVTSSASTGSTSSSTSASTGTGGAAPILYEVDVSQSPCFTLDTGTANADNPCTGGDLYFLSGLNVDLGSADNSAPAYCVKPGVAKSLDAVPSDYAACTWEAYVEGAGGLENTGYVVRDRVGTHHYRMQIVSNTLPKLTFHYAKID